MDDQRLPDYARLADPARRLARRSLRAPADLPDRRRLVHHRVGAVRVRAERRSSDPGPRDPGRRRRPPYSGEPRDHRSHLPAGRPRPGNRSVVGAHRHRGRHGPARRRLPDRRRQLAGDLPDQPAARRVRRLGIAAPRSGDPRPDHDGRARHSRIRVRDARPRGSHVRPDPVPRRRARIAGRPGSADRRDQLHGCLRAHGAPRPPADAPPLDLLLAPIHQREPGHLRRLRRTRRRLLPARRLPAGRAGLHRDRSRRRVAPDNGANAAALPARGRARPAHRPADSAHGRVDSRRRGHVHDERDRYRRQLRQRDPAGDHRVRPRSHARGRPGHDHRPRRRRPAPGWDRLWRQQRGCAHGRASGGRRVADDRGPERRRLRGSDRDKRRLHDRDEGGGRAGGRRRCARVLHHQRRRARAGEAAGPAALPGGPGSGARASLRRRRDPAPLGRLFPARAAAG